MHTQITDTVLMVRPVRFRSNDQTATTNSLQPTARRRSHRELREVQAAALAEFDGVVEAIEQAGVTVHLETDTFEPDTPDSIFPNNWFSTHSDGTLVLYPMLTQNRREERRKDVTRRLVDRFRYRTVLDFTRHETDDRECLEGTGSLVLDRAHKVAYMCESDRSSPRLLDLWARHLGYKPILFHASETVYHTNVVLAIGEQTAVLCSELIANVEERYRVVRTLRETGHNVVEIDRVQALGEKDDPRGFACNLLQVSNAARERLWLMSTRALESLTPSQREALAADSRLVHAPIPTIEGEGGGSVRCMLGEIFVPSHARRS